MNYKYIFTILALGFLIPSLFIPWTSIDLLGENSSYTPLKIVKNIITIDNSNITFNLVKMIQPYNLSYYTLISSMILYLASFILLYLSTRNSKFSNKLLLIAGIIIILSIGTYLYSLDSYKSEFSKALNSSGGTMGEEFIGSESIIIDTIIKNQIGYKIALLAGLFAIMGYIWKPQHKNG